jgi:hypothetical protein
VACVAAIAALAFSSTRPLGALAGVVISAFALGGLVVSYGREGGLFGWSEGGFRTAIVLAVFTEVAAVVLLSTALAAMTVALEARGPRRRSSLGEPSQVVSRVTAPPVASDAPRPAVHARGRT